jgi:hypothetical protein
MARIGGALMLALGTCFVLAFVATVATSRSIRGSMGIGWILATGIVLVALGWMLLRDGRIGGPLVQRRAEPLARKRPDLPADGKPPVIDLGWRKWDPEHALGGRWKVDPPPEAKGVDAIRVPLSSSVTDRHVQRALRKALRAARRALPHRGGVRAEARVTDGGRSGDRELQVRLHVHADILHAGDREACARAFHAQLQRSLPHNG